MKGKRDLLTIVDRLLIQILGLALVLCGCKFLEQGAIPINLCSVKTDDRFFPRIHGQPYTQNQLAWLAGSDSILLKNDAGRLYLVNTREDSTMRLQDTGIDGLSFALAPSTGDVAVLTYAEGDLIESNIYNLEGGNLIVRVPDLGRGSFSPDGRLLAGGMFDDDESWVGIVDLENLSENPIEIMPTRGRRDYYLESWSHRPDWISIRETTRTGIKISVVEWPSGKVIPLQEFLGCRENSSWSPITHELAYQGNLNHNWDIFVELPGANNARNLTSTGEVNEYQPAWSPDGKYIAYVGVETRPGETTFWQELFVINVETGEKVQLTDSWDEYESLPIWSPDGTSIAYLSERNGALYLDSIEPNGANRTDLVRVPD